MQTSVSCLIILTIAPPLYLHEYDCVLPKTVYSASFKELWTCRQCLQWRRWRACRRPDWSSTQWRHFRHQPTVWRQLAPCPICCHVTSYCDETAVSWRHRLVRQKCLSRAAPFHRPRCHGWESFAFASSTRQHRYRQQSPGSTQSLCRFVRPTRDLTINT